MCRERRKGCPAARSHIALNGCRQGYNYVGYVHGAADIANQPHYGNHGNRYVKTTGYKASGDNNDIVVLYVQEEGSNGGASSHPGVAHPRHEPA
jgi:hypothetical protein